MVAGTSKPDHARCVSIVTGAALMRWCFRGILPWACQLRWGYLPQLQCTVVSSGAVAVQEPQVGVTINGIPVNLSGASAVAGFADGGNDLRCVACHVDEQRGGGAWTTRRSGLKLASSAAEVRRTQGCGGGRYGWRSFQGHCWALASRADQTAGDDHAGARAALPVAHYQKDGAAKT